MMRTIMLETTVANRSTRCRQAATREHLLISSFCRSDYDEVFVVHVTSDAVRLKQQYRVL
jgi:hypothetical protein